MTSEYQLRILPRQAASEQDIIAYLEQEKGIDPKAVTHVRVLKRSIDARQRTVMVNLKVRVYVGEEPEETEYIPTEYHSVDNGP